MDLGIRLSEQERRLRLLLAHLAGPALRARVDVDDLLQEVYLRALSSAADAPPGPEEPLAEDPRLFGWLRVLARHTVIDAVRALRAAKRDGPVVRLEPHTWSRSGLGPGGGRGGVGTVADPGPGPPTAAGAREAERALERAFRALAPEHRRVLGLRQFEGLSAAESAVRMGRSESAVHSLYRRALAAWQAALAAAPEVSSGSGDESGDGLRPFVP